MRVHIQNRIVAFGQQHVNQRQISATIKAGFSFNIYSTMRFLPPQVRLVFTLMVFKVHCQAKIQAS